MRHGLMHLDHVVTRNVMRVGSVRDPVAFRRYVEVLALSTAGLPSSATLFQAAHINQRTTDAYDSVLQNLYLLDLMPPWSSNHLSRLVKRSKRYIVDAALAASAARVDAKTILLNGDLLGRILDTFVMTQMRPEVAFMHPRAQLHHVRYDNGKLEVDAVIDMGAGRIIGVELTSLPRLKP